MRRVVLVQEARRGQGPLRLLGDEGQMRDHTYGVARSASLVRRWALLLVPGPAADRPAERVVDATGGPPRSRARRADPARQRTAVVSVLLAAVSVVVNLVRQPGSALDNIWAEDGRTFMALAWREPFWRAVTQPYGAT